MYNFKIFRPGQSNWVFLLNSSLRYGKITADERTYANVRKSAPPSAEVHNIGHKYHEHYSHAEGLSVDDHVHENNVRGIYVREYQSLVEISSISIRIFFMFLCP